MTRSWIPLSADILHEIFKFVLFHKSINYKNGFKQLLNLAHVNKTFRSIIQSSRLLTNSKEYEYCNSIFSGSNIQLFVASSPFQNIRESLVVGKVKSNHRSNPEKAKSQALDSMILLENCINLKTLETGDISITEFSKKLNPSRIVCKLDHLDIGSFDRWNKDVNECKSRTESLESIISIFKSLNKNFTVSSTVCECKAGILYEYGPYSRIYDDLLKVKKCNSCRSLLPEVCHLCILKLKIRRCNCDNSSICDAYACAKCCCVYCGDYMSDRCSYDEGGMKCCENQKCPKTACEGCSMSNFITCSECYESWCWDCSSGSWCANGCGSFFCAKCSKTKCSPCASCWKVTCKEKCRKEGKNESECVERESEDISCEDSDEEDEDEEEN